MKVLNDLIEAIENVQASKNKFEALYLSRFKLAYNLLEFVETDGPTGVEFTGWELQFWTNDGPMFILYGEYPGEHCTRIERWISSEDFITNWSSWFSKMKGIKAAIRERDAEKSIEYRKSMDDIDRRLYLELKAKFEGNE